MRLLLDTHVFLWLDPFDRLLVSQAFCEQTAIVSRAPAFDDYAVRRIW